jgi:hypothetical protein
MKAIKSMNDAANHFFHLLHRHRKPFRRSVALLLALAVLNMSVGCMNYFRVNSSVGPTAESISGLKAAQKTIIVHYNDDKWILKNISINNNILTGRADPYNYPPTLKPVKSTGPNRYLTRASRSQSYLLNEVHIYPSEYNETGNGMISMPVTSIEKMEIYEKDLAATVGSWTLGFLGVTAGAFTIFLILVAIFKESCPFIYTWDGENYQFAGEIYSGSIYKNLERHDYLRLPFYPDQQSYQLKITNEAYEIQRTNQLELVVADHQKNCEVMMDKNGKVLTLSSPQPPVTATNLRNQDITLLLRDKDRQIYQTASTTGDYDLTDGVILQFPSPGKAETAKLAIRAKNSVMLDFMLGKFHDMFGSAYHYIMKMQGEQPREELVQWTLDQGIPLSVSVKRNNNWDFVDYYNVAGPMAFKDDVLEIPLQGNENSPLEVKLEFGSFFWEIDYAAIDYSTAATVTTYTMPVRSAVNERGKDVSRLLRSDDSKYYTQPATENNAVVTFDLPAANGLERTIYLHSKGWYELIRNPRGPHDKEYLLTFKQPGRFNQFVLDEIKKMEQTASKPE